MWEIDTQTMAALFYPLREEGYFVEVVGSVPNTVDQYIVECTIYITEREEDGSAQVLRVNMNDPLETSNGDCVVCSFNVPKRHTNRFTQCPICHMNTLSWQIRPKRYQGIFQLVPDAPALFLAASELPPNVYAMKSVQMIQSISSALTKAIERLGSMVAGGGIESSSPYRRIG
jgi:hypothetical protein